MNFKSNLALFSAILGFGSVISACQNPSTPCSLGSASCPLNQPTGTPTPTSTPSSNPSSSPSSSPSASPTPSPKPSPAPSTPIITAASISPANGATGVSVAGTVINVAVAGGVDASSLMYDTNGIDTVILMDSAGKSMPIQVTTTANGFSIRTTGCSLYPNTTYTLSLSGIFNNATPQQSLAGTVTTTFKTAGNYMGPTCEDPVLSLLPPTTLVGGAPLPSPIESYNLIFVPGTCNASPSVDQTSGNQKINVLASQFQPVAGSNMVSYTISQQFAAGQNVRFVAQACLPGSNCSVDTNEACDVVAPPN